MYNVWITDYYIAGVLYWKCENCQTLIPYSQNAMCYCGHCGEPKYYAYNEIQFEQIKKQEYS